MTIVVLALVALVVVVLVAARRQRTPRPTHPPLRYPLRDLAPAASRSAGAVTVGMSKRDVLDRLGTPPIPPITAAELFGGKLVVGGLSRETLQQEFWLYENVPAGRSTEIVIDHRGIVTSVDVKPMRATTSSTAPTTVPTKPATPPAPMEVGMIRTTFATDGSALPEQHERVARRLAELITVSDAQFSALSDADQTLWLDTKRIDEFVAGTRPTPKGFADRVELRTIGHQLNEEGGKPLMRQVAERATVLTGRRSVLSLISLHWNWIGGWMS